MRLPASLIIIIDDDESMRLALAGLVRSFGFETRTYGSAEEFLAAKAEPSCCIITDIRMPGLSGIELTRRLAEAACAAPVILVTGRTEPYIEEQARVCGAVCLLKKPFDADTLLACLRRANVT
jgi:FixJ family two-component response regulator